MKKVVMCLVTAVLLCVICTSFVSCNSIPLSLYEFAKKNEFSFGEFIEDEIINIGGREVFDSQYAEASAAAADPYFGSESALLLKEDNITSRLFSDIQEIYNNSIEGYISARIEDESNRYNRTNPYIPVDEYLEQELREQKIADYVERNKTAFTNNHITNAMHVMSPDSDVGVLAMYGELLDGKSVAKNWVVKKQQKDNFTYYYIFEILMGCKDEFSYLHIKTQIIVYDKDGWQTEDFASLCEAFWYYGDVGYEDVMIDMPRGIFWALQGLSVDELYELGKGSFDILEEVIGAWIKYESEQVKLYQ